MRLLHLFHHDGLFSWESEAKAILTVNNIDRTLNSESFGCFMQLGYLLDENTWFKHIKLIKPSTIIEYEIKSYSIEQNIIGVGLR